MEHIKTTRNNFLDELKSNRTFTKDEGIQVSSCENDFLNETEEGRPE